MNRKTGLLKRAKLRKNRASGAQIRERRMTAGKLAALSGWMRSLSAASLPAVS